MYIKTKEDGIYNTNCYQIIKVTEKDCNGCNKPVHVVAIGNWQEIYRGTGWFVLKEFDNKEEAIVLYDEITNALSEGVNLFTIE